MPARNLNHGSLVIKDGAGSPASLTVPIMEGDLEWEEANESHAISNRGTLKEFTIGQETPVTVKFTITFERWQGKPAGTPSVIDALMKRGNAATWTSTGAGNSLKQNAPFTTLLEFTLADPEGSGGGYNEVISLNHFACDRRSFKEGADADRVTITGKAMIAKVTTAANAS